jgi:hypothetical protein
MGEARLRAEEKLAALNAANPTMADRAHVMLNELCENIAKNYAELEKAVSERVEVSRQNLLAWQAETRELVRYARSIRLTQPA